MITKADAKTREYKNDAVIKDNSSQDSYWANDWNWNIWDDWQEPVLPTLDMNTFGLPKVEDHWANDWFSGLGDWNNDDYWW